MDFNFYSQELFATPSRKPSEHHCNADKKHRPPQTFQLDPSLCRNLFGQSSNTAGSLAPPKVNILNARSFR